MKCPKCGTQMKGKTCPKCGYTVGQDDAKQGPPAKGRFAPPPAKKGGKVPPQFQKKRGG